MDDFIGLIAVILIFSIPIVAIVGKQFLKYKQLELDKINASKNTGIRVGTADLDVIKRDIAQVSLENEKLKKRVSNLEKIINRDELAKLNTLSGIDNEIIDADAQLNSEILDSQNTKN